MQEDNIRLFVLQSLYPHKGFQGRGHNWDSQIREEGPGNRPFTYVQLKSLRPEAILCSHFALTAMQKECAL